MQPSGHAFGVPKDKLRAIRENANKFLGPSRISLALHPGYKFAQRHQ
jgi:hypothetical protein